MLSGGEGCCQGVRGVVSGRGVLSGGEECCQWVSGVVSG